MENETDDLLFACQGLAAGVGVVHLARGRHTSAHVQLELGCRRVLYRQDVLDATAPSLNSVHEVRSAHRGSSYVATVAIPRCPPQAPLSLHISLHTLGF